VNATLPPLVVGVGGLAVADAPERLVTYALGSCVGVAAYDPVARCGGLWHVMLPLAQVNPERALREPGAFADTGAPAFARALLARGALLRRLRVCIAGGADSAQLGPGFEIGRRNVVAVRRWLWQQGLLLEGEDCGGAISRTLRLDLSTGAVQVRRSDGIINLGA
jgi:chemotaxis protein CheD